MPFFTSAPKKPSAVFAGIDDPFNFPSAKMRYTTRSSSRTSSPDSGYGSIDDDAQLSPKSSAVPQSKQRLKKDGKGHWRMHSYEYQSTENDGVAERTPILAQEATFSSPLEEKTRAPDNAHVFVPNPQRTFTLICDEGEQAKAKAKAKAKVKVKPTERSVSKDQSKPRSAPKEKEKEKEGWFERRVYGRALQRRERSEGVSELQRQMAPVLRRASPAPERELVHRRPSASAQRPSAGQRKGSTLLHPSPPTSAPSSRPASPRPSFGIKTTIVGGLHRTADEPPARGRPRKPSTLLHPSPPPRLVSSSPPSRDSTRSKAVPDTEALRSPRHRSKTPLRIPDSSASQPTPTPLRIRVPHCHRRRKSVLHSCFSSDEEEEEEGELGSESGGDSDADTAAGVCDGGADADADADTDAWSVSSAESAGASTNVSLSVSGVHNEVILARTGMVARAQRVRVGKV